MNNQQKATAVALHLQPMMGMLNDFFDAAVGKGQHNIILLVGAGDVEQYVANVPRERGIQSLQSLLARWKVGLPDTMPGEVTPGDAASFDYLLREYEEAVAREARGNPSLSISAAHARANLTSHVGELVAKLNRSTPP